MRYTTAAVAVILLCCCREKKSTSVAEKNSTQTTQTTAEPAAAIRQEPEMLHTVFTGREIQVQKFTVSHTRTQTVTGRNGFKVTVNPARLCKPDGSAVTAPVVVEIKELVSAMDMLLANAPTMSNGRMLESGGAYYVGMRSEGQALRIRGGERLTVQVPKISKKGMELFYGEPDAGGQVNWKPAGTNFTAAVPAKEYTGSPVRVRSVIREIKTGDSIVTRPATLAECVLMYRDSVIKARTAFGTANRDRLGHRYVMSVYLQPIVFPFDRFKKGVVFDRRYYTGGKRVNRIKGKEVAAPDSISKVWSSTMYMIPDTIPVYKKVRDTLAATGEQVTATGDGLAYYTPAEIDRLGWINCDRFLKENLPITKDIRIQLPDSGTVETAKVYVLFHSINSVVVEHFSDSRPLQTLRLENSMPEGAAVTLILLGVRNHKLYISRQEAVLRSGSTVNMQLQPLRSGSLAAELKG